MVLLVSLQIVSNNIFSSVKDSHVRGHQHVSPKLPVTLKPHSPNWLPLFLPVPISLMHIIHTVDPTATYPEMLK